uniref:Glycosyltransferase n=2 Tax=unclassified Prevotella TaxID=2638335 RepID=A0AB33J5K9_9BACT
MDELKAQCNFPYQTFKVHYLGGYSRAFARGLNKLIRKNNPEFVFVPEFSIIALQVIILRWVFGYKYKIISLCDDSYDMIQGNDFSRVHRYSRKLIVPFVDNLILNNAKSCKWYQENYHKGVYFPIITDERVFRHKVEASLPLAAKLQEQYQLSHRKIILYVGRLMELKRIDDLLHAFRLVKEDAVLVVIGSGAEEQRLKALDAVLDTHAIFLEWKVGQELFAWYALADVLVLPSRQEAFGAVVNEGLISGCLCVVSDKCGSETLVTPSVNGFIFKSLDIADLSEKIGLALDKVSKSSSLTLKPNMMPFSFDQMLCDIAKNLNLFENRCL